MAVTETYIATLDPSEKLLRVSGQFTSTVRDSLPIAPGPTCRDISWNGANTPWPGLTTKKLYLQSGNFTSTIKTSQATSKGSLAIDVDINNNTPYAFFAPSVLYLQSGVFTSTIKTSLALAADIGVQGISFDGVNTFYIASATDRVYRSSGQYTTVIKESLSLIGNVPSGGCFDGTNVPWVPRFVDVLYLHSGYFTSTIKTSLSFPPYTYAGINVDDYKARQGVPPPPPPGVMSSNQSQVAQEDPYEDKVEADVVKTEKEALKVERVMAQSDAEKSKAIAETNALITGMSELI